MCIVYQSVCVDLCLYLLDKILCVCSSLCLYDSGVSDRCCVGVLQVPGSLCLYDSGVSDRCCVGVLQVPGSVPRHHD